MGIINHNFSHILDREIISINFGNIPDKREIKNGYCAQIPVMEELEISVSLMEG